MHALLGWVLGMVVIQQSIVTRVQGISPWGCRTASRLTGPGLDHTWNLKALLRQFANTSLLHTLDGTDDTLQQSLPLLRGRLDICWRRGITTNVNVNPGRRE